MSDPSKPAAPSPDVERIDLPAMEDAGEAAAEGHAAAEGVEAAPTTDDMGGPESTIGQLRQMALATEPETPLEAIDSPWQPEQGGLTRVYRGVMKATGFDGVPAILDIAIGAVEVLYNADRTGGDGGGESSSGGDAGAYANADDPIAAAAAGSDE